MAEENQKLGIAILEFLEKSITDGSVLEDDKQEIEVARPKRGAVYDDWGSSRTNTSSSHEAFGVSHFDEAQRQKLSIKPATLQSLFEVHLKEMVATPETIGMSPRAAKATTGAPSNSSTSSATNKSLAEQLRIKGNGLIASKDYVGAIAAYTSAITMDPTNALYYSNRAAARSSSGNHRGAAKDAQRAIELDSNMVPAYHRLGHAFYCLREYRESANAFQRGLDLDRNNTNLKFSRDRANARIPSVSTPKPIPPTAAGGVGGLSDLLGGLGPLGGDSGGNIISGILQNPDVMTMIQQLLAQDGGLGSLIGDHQ